MPKKGDKEFDEVIDALVQEGKRKLENVEHKVSRGGDRESTWCPVHRRHYKLPPGPPEMDHFCPGCDAPVTRQGPEVHHAVFCGARGSCGCQSTLEWTDSNTTAIDPQRLIANGWRLEPGDVWVCPEKHVKI